MRLYSRPGNDLTRRFPLIVETLARLRLRSCIIDGEAVACGDIGIASFDLVRHHRANSDRNSNRSCHGSLPASLSFRYRQLPHVIRLTTITERVAHFPPLLVPRSDAQTMVAVF